jgi:hypothetical protein
MSIERDGDGPPLRRQEPKAPSTPGDGRTDLRATPFTDDVFGEDDYRGRRSRRAADENKSFSVIVGVILGLVVAGGAGWFFLRDGGDITASTDTAGFIKSDPMPYKVRPENPGGMQVENQDKLVYDRVAKGNAPNRVENLLPPAEEPKAPPVKKVEPPPVAEAPKPAPEPEAAKVEPAKPEPAKAEAVKPEPAKPEPAKAEVAAVEPAKPEPAKPEPAKAEAAKPAEPEEAPEEDLAAAIAAAMGQAKPPAAKPAAEPPAETQVAAGPSPAPTAAASGAFHIQLASVLSEEAAQAEWKRVSSKNKDLLGAYKPLITKADLGERGVFFRLRAGPLADKAAADALCASLEEAKVGCIVIKP